MKKINMELILPDEETFIIFRDVLISWFEILDPNYFSEVKISEVLPNGNFNSFFLGLGKSFFDEDF